MIVDYATTAQDDLESIELWIARDDPVRAAALVDDLIDRADGLSIMPLRFPLVDDPRLPGVRRLNHRGYRILFTVEAERVLVLHVHHGARDRPAPAA